LEKYPSGGLGSGDKPPEKSMCPRERPTLPYCEDGQCLMWTYTGTYDAGRIQELTKARNNESTK